MKERRQKLRRESPKAELILWRYLKGRQIGDFKFRRQYSIGGYVVDFYCPELRLVIEVDGPTHFLTKEAKINDKKRQEFIETFSIDFLRFTNYDIYNNIEGVIENILNQITRVRKV
ncbi:MAG: endonuclease domain-containing protein [Candidatus Kerfeldbacteria bacterium]